MAGFDTGGGCDAVGPSCMISSLVLGVECIWLAWKGGGGGVVDNLGSVSRPLEGLRSLPLRAMREELGVGGLVTYDF